MAIEDILNMFKRGVTRVKDYFSIPSKVQDMRDYAIRNYLTAEQRERLFKGKSEEEIRRLYSTLEDKIHRRLEEHKDILDRFTVKLGKYTGLATLLYDAYNFYRGTPFSQFWYGKIALLGAKAALELPAMYLYLKDSHDFYGALEWLGGKVVAGLLPVLGPMFETNSMARIVKKHVIKDAIDDFVKEEKVYTAREPLGKSVYDRIKNVTGSPPVVQPGYQYA